MSPKQRRLDSPTVFRQPKLNALKKVKINEDDEEVIEDLKTKLIDY